MESVTGIVWLVHGKILLRATPEKLRPATIPARVMGELQDTNLDVFTQVVENLREAVDLTVQAGATMVESPDQTDKPSPQADPSPEALKLQPWERVRLGKAGQVNAPSESRLFPSCITSGGPLPLWSRAFGGS